MTRYAKRVDANQAEVAAACQAAGWSIWYTYMLGRGVPDLVAYKPGGLRVWLEVKQPGEDTTKAEKEFFALWGPGPKLIVYGPQDAIDKLAELERRPWDGLAEHAGLYPQKAG